MLPFNKYANGLRRLDEAEPENTRINPSEMWHGGFSAMQSRLRRFAKSRRKAGLRLRPSRHMKLS